VNKELVAKMVAIWEEDVEDETVDGAMARILSMIDAQHEQAAQQRVAEARAAAFREAAQIAHDMEACCVCSACLIPDRTPPHCEDCSVPDETADRRQTVGEAIEEAAKR
jgi:hypothetical protein